MDSFSDPSPPFGVIGHDVSPEQVRAQIRALEEEHRAQNTSLTGRIIHVCHDLPIISTLANRSDVLSPPATPPTNLSDLSDSPDAISETPGVADKAVEPTWVLAPRHGHDAMISGIRSLNATHQQLIIGWTGDIKSATSGELIPTSLIGESSRAALDVALESFHTDNDRKTTYVPLWLDDASAHHHYDGYCKQILWPLFHYLLWQDVATEYGSADKYYPAYEAVNLAFARRIAEIYLPGDLIWVHDYHLLLVPRLLRDQIGGLKGADAVVGLFVHTPFPSSEVFRCLPRRKEILDGMLGANLVCFQTYSYLRHFTSTCVRVCGYESTPRGIDNQGHVTAVGYCPVGVDADRVARDLLLPGIQPKLEVLLSHYEGKKIIVGRDKLDVVQGVLQKLKAFERLLQDYPEWVGKVVLIQVTTPSLTSTMKLDRQVSEIVAHINGEYGSLDFSPIHHYHQALPKDEYYALLGVGDLALITPLRDGMNTTSMEFVIAQERTKRSPIVLSEFMGISKIMEDALQINPWDLGDVAAALHKGLTMSEAEKLERHQRLLKVVTTQTSHTWSAILVKMLLSQVNSRNTARQTPHLDCLLLEEQYRKAQKRLFLFDYDGTLAPIVKMPSMAIPSGSTLEALAKLSADPKNLVYIISGRDGDFLEQHLGHLMNVGFSAEHGGFIRERGETSWKNLTQSIDMSWMNEVLEVFKYYTERTTGSHVEVKKSAITWHYRASDPEWGQFQCRQCQDLLENNLAHKRPIEVLLGKKNLEVRPIAVNKGEIVKRILYKNPDAEFIFCAGDDKTDEDMFRALLLFPVGVTKAVMEPPVSVMHNGINGEVPQSVELAISPEAIFTTAVGHSNKRTLASWHVTTTTEVVDNMLHIANLGSEASTKSVL